MAAKPRHVLLEAFFDFCDFELRPLAIEAAIELVVVEVTNWLGEATKGAGRLLA